jgi:integrase
MARTIHRLSPAMAKNAGPGMHCDGGGLYLRASIGVGGQVNRSWVFRFAAHDGRERYMGLGSLHDVSLAEARERAAGARKQHLSGADPIDARKLERGTAAAERAKTLTFIECADQYIAAHRAGWRNVKHAAQWEATLSTYAEPIIGALPVQAIDTALVMRVLEQEIRDEPDKPAKRFWTTRPETAGRLRGRIESILNWAKVRGYRHGENPARWRGHLDHLLPGRGKVRAVKHHAALPYSELGTFMALLRERDAVAALALEFAILTAARTSEVIGAQWSEIDLQGNVWTVPADRMKGGREHRVPLSDAAISVLNCVAEIRENDHVFPGERRPALSNMAFLMLLRRMRRGDLTVHGFRSTFRDWAAECTNLPNEVVEMALAHAVAGKVEAAYLFEKRRRLMDAWAQFCSEEPTHAHVVSLAGRAARQSAG